MPIDETSPIEVTALAWVPAFARGFVRDLRVRWALEAGGIDRGRVAKVTLDHLEPGCLEGWRHVGLGVVEPEEVVGALGVDAKLLRRIVGHG